MKRLEAIYSQIPFCECLIDIGTDHGFIAKMALSKAKKVIASDISEVCLQKAKNLLRDEKNVEFIVSDGLKRINQEHDCICICGMGAKTICDILSDYEGNARLILQPNNNTERLREFLNYNKFKIISDIIVLENNFFYDIISYERGVEYLDEYQILFGKFYKNKNELFIKRLNMMINKTLSFKKTEKNQQLIELMLNAKKNYKENQNEFR